jgi:hypothetical protein
LLFETEGEQFFGEDGSRLQSDVFQLGQGGAPGGALGTEEIVGQFFGDAFEIGAKGFDCRVDVGGCFARHPWPPGGDGERE